MSLQSSAIHHFLVKMYVYSSTFLECQQSYFSFINKASVDRDGSAFVVEVGLKSRGALDGTSLSFFPPCCYSACLSSV